MGRAPCCSKEGMNKGAWTSEEDQILTTYITTHGEGKWRSLPKQAGLKRCGKSCRLRWLNYLRPDIKRGNISEEEEDLIIRLHKLLGNRWSLIAGRLPGRTDNEVKNYWNTTLSKKIKSPISNNNAKIIINDVNNNYNIHENTEPDLSADPQSSEEMEKQESFQNLQIISPSDDCLDVEALLPSDYNQDQDLWKICDRDHRSNELDYFDGYRLPSVKSSWQQSVIFSEEMLLEYWTDD